MKYLILILVVLAVVWWLRGSGRRADAAAKQPPRDDSKAPPALPENIVACAYCGLHLPSREALPGRGGVFCGEAHRADYERRHPPG
jgi:uncharacterized protein